MKIIKLDRMSEARGVIRLPGACELLGVSRATIWRWVDNDPSFPQPFKLSEGVTVWDEAEVLQWIEAKKSMRGAA